MTRPITTVRIVTDPLEWILRYKRDLLILDTKELELQKEFAGIAFRRAVLLKQLATLEARQFVEKSTATS